MRRITSFLLVFTVIFSVPVFGSKIESAKQDLRHVKASIEKSKKELGLTRKEKEAVEREIKALDEVIIETENELQKINENLELKRLELQESEKELAIAEEEKEQQYEDAKVRIESMYKNQKVGYIEIIFTSKDFWEMLNRMDYIRKIGEYDQALLDTMKANQEKVKMRTEQIEAEEREIALLYKEQVGIKSRLDASKDEKNSLLNKLLGDEAYLQTEIEEMDRVSAEIESQIQELIEQNRIEQERIAKQNASSQHSMQYSGGQFLWPVPGSHRVSSGYGNRIHPISRSKRFHAGIDIAAGFGRPVVAAADGRVITAGWLGGYGNTVMIDHGSGLVSLYGHNSSLTVSRGDRVKKGDQIARIGSTGQSTGNHLHFEVRLKGSHTNPYNYLK